MCTIKYIYIYVRRNVVPLLPLYVYILFLRFEREREREQREKGGYYGHSYAAPPVRLRGLRCGLFQRRDLQYRWGLRYNVLLLLAISQHDKSFQPAPASIPFLSSLPFAPACVRAPTSPVPVGAPRPLFSFLSSFARGDREDGYSETTRPRRRKKKVLSGATRVCLTGNTARIESRLSSPSPPRSFVLPQMAACLCRASTPRSLLNRMPLPILFSSRVKREFLSSSSAPRHLSRGYYIIAEFC